MTVESVDRGGSPSVEAAILAGVVALFIGLALAGGRLVSAEAAVGHAAQAAARVASQHRDASSADAAARTAARNVLDSEHLHCASVTVAVDTTGFGVAVGIPASVRATVRCAVDWSDLGLAVVPGDQVVAADFVSPIDQWRERT